VMVAHSAVLAGSAHLVGHGHLATVRAWVWDLAEPPAFARGPLSSRTVSNKRRSRAALRPLIRYRSVSAQRWTSDKFGG